MRRGWLIPIAFVAGAAVGAGVLRSRLDRYPDGSMRWHRADVRVDYFEPLPILVAVDDVPAGTMLHDGLAAQRRLPEQFIDPAMLKPEELPSLRGQILLEPLQAGEPLRRTLLARPGSIDNACAELVRAVNGKQTALAQAKLEAVRALVLP
jgi:Flp pilus assembly protein CpaB